jgi:proteasome accessory factor A
MMQIVLAMIEAGCVNPQLLLEDPLDAVKIVSADPSLEARIRLAGGSLVTAVEHQQRFFDEAARFVRAGGCDGVVPDAPEILEWWGRALDKLAARDFGVLTRWLDWVLKLAIVETARVEHALGWNAPELKQLDFQYGNLENGLYWIYERADAVERLVAAGTVERFMHQPPPDTRAWTRAALLREANPACLDDIDWDRIRFRFDAPDGWPRWRHVSLANPLGFTRRDCQTIFEESDSFARVLDRLEELGDAGGCIEPQPLALQPPGCDGAHSFPSPTGDNSNANSSANSPNTGKE